MTTHLLQVFDNPLDPEIQPVSFVSEDVNGDLSVTRDLSVGRDAAITRNETVGGTLQVTGAVTLSAALGVGGNINAGQSVFANTGVVHGLALTSGEDCTVGRDLTVTRNAAVHGQLDVDNDITTPGAVSCDDLTTTGVATMPAANVTNFGIGAGSRATTQAAIPDGVDPTVNSILAVLRTFRFIAT